MSFNSLKRIGLTIVKLALAIVAAFKFTSSLPIKYIENKNKEQSSEKIEQDKEKIHEYVVNYPKVDFKSQVKLVSLNNSRGVK